VRGEAETGKPSCDTVLTALSMGRPTTLGTVALPELAQAATSEVKRRERDGEDCPPATGTRRRDRR
jgi:hypothetical protein